MASKTAKSLDERIDMTKSAIEKEEEAIKARRERLRKLQSELQGFVREKERVFTDEFMRIVASSGISSDEEKQELLKLVQKSAVDLKPKVASAVESVSEETPLSFSAESNTGDTK